MLAASCAGKDDFANVCDANLLSMSSVLLCAVCASIDECIIISVLVSVVVCFLFRALFRIAGKKKLQHLVPSSL
jgi:hypothetical protein